MGGVVFGSRFFKIVCIKKNKQLVINKPNNELRQ